MEYFFVLFGLGALILFSLTCWPWSRSVFFGGGFIHGALKHLYLYKSQANISRAYFSHPNNSQSSTAKQVAISKDSE